VKAPALILLLLLCVAPPSGVRARQSDSTRSQPESNKGAKGAERTLYRIELDLDFDGRAFAGRERVRWVNRDDRAANAVYFHLYPNLRAEDERPSAQTDAATPEEPRLEVTEARVAGGASLPFTSEDDGATIRVQLREAVPAGLSVEL